MKNKLMWFLNAVMFSVILVLLSCGSVRRVAIVNGELPSNGRTICSLNNMPIIIVAQHVTDSVEVSMILTHEYVHVNQMWKDCGRFLRQYQTDNDFRIKNELEAYCADGAERVRAGWRAQEVMEGIKGVMLRIYGADTTKIRCPKVH